MNFYSDIQPIDYRIPAQRQKAKRHYGVHPYFTRRPFNVIREYILRFSKELDCIVDPFGGSGVTAIEAFLENRIAIHNDINPLANFIAQGIANLTEESTSSYKDALDYLRVICQPIIAEIERGDTSFVANLLESLRLPANVRLPSNADAEYYTDLFTPRQLAGLALLKTHIDKISNKQARNAMLIAWSATLTKLNKTFLSAKGRAASRGGSSIFSIYRYKIAKEPVELPIWATFEERVRNVIAAKREIDKTIRFKYNTGGWYGSFEVRNLDIGDLAEQLEGKVDYIFTDPPYGGHISYIDLSILWNNWLGSMPSRKLIAKEIIVGGELRHTEEEYLERLRSSVHACVQMLKDHRWFSLVFQHWNVAYFETILSAATESGAELKSAVPQVGDPIWSMHKKKNKESCTCRRNDFDLSQDRHPARPR